MNMHMTVPEGATAIDLQAERYRTASEKIASGQRQFNAGREQSKEGRALWIEGVLDLATVVAEKRIDLPDHRAFGRWLQKYCLEPYSDADLAALRGFSHDIPAARKMLEDSQSISFRCVWEKIPKKKPKRTPSEFGGGDIPSRGRQSGSRQRKRAAIIPECMRDDYVPGSIKARAADRPAESKRRRRGSGRVVTSPPMAERAVVRLKALKPAEVDPDFKGTPLEFTAKYGHVLLQTKQQIEYHKQQEQLMAWLGPVSDHAKTARLLLAAIAADPATLREWMAKPTKAEKLQAWCASIEQACESVRKIIATAKPGAIALALKE